jgi:putative ABC transport system permease protein
MVRAEAALVGVAGSALGCLLGVIWAPLLARWIAGQGLSPAWFSVQLSAGSVPALVIAFLAGVAVAVASVLVAGRRAGMIRPTEALREAAVEPARISPGRLVGCLELLLGIAIAYSAIGIASTSLMSTSGRRSELALLRLTGVTRRQIVWIVAAESLALTIAAVAASAAISAWCLAGCGCPSPRRPGSPPSSFRGRQSG